MAVSERYHVGGRRGPWRVLDRERRISVAIAECGVKKDAEKIVRALNHLEGAVDPYDALLHARAAMARQMLNDETLDLPFNEDMAEAIRRVEAVLSSTDRGAV